MLAYLAILIIIVILLAAFIKYLYRSPELEIPWTMPCTVIKPCDGTLKKVSVQDGYVNIYWFLGVLDIHTQYMPINGYIEDIQYYEGPLYPAMDLELSRDNKRIITFIRVNGFEKPVILEQVCGMITPKVENYLRYGREYQIGTKLGHIHFGSQVILRLPLSGMDGDSIRNIKKMEKNRLSLGQELTCLR